MDVAELRAPSLAQLEREIGSGGAPEIWRFLEWARGEFPYRQVYACQSREHALRIGLALCAALEYHDPALGYLHGFTERRLVNVAGSAR